MKQRIKNQTFRPRDKFTERELKQIFNKENYLFFLLKKEDTSYLDTTHFSIFRNENGEITPLYFDNIIPIQGSHRKTRWCFDILEERDRPDKNSNTFIQIVPIHETLIDIGFLEFIELLKKKNPDRKRLFEELPYGENGYNRNVTRFFNSRYLPKLGLSQRRKTSTVLDIL